MAGNAGEWSLARLLAPRACALGRLRLVYDETEVPILGMPAHIVGALLIRREGISLGERQVLVSVEADLGVVAQLGDDGRHPVGDVLEDHFSGANWEFGDDDGGRFTRFTARRQVGSAIRWITAQSIPG